LCEAVAILLLRLDCRGAIGIGAESDARVDLQELTGEDVDCGSAASRISESRLICSEVNATELRVNHQWWRNHREHTLTFHGSTDHLSHKTDPLREWISFNFGNESCNCSVGNF
jgi:hypothetical protein